jgi:Fe-S cluster biosynthesis and repair protein YggX
MSEKDSQERIVQCVKLGKEAKGLDKPPFSGELGEQIFHNISAEAWGFWMNDLMIKVINEYRLNLADKDDYAKLLDQMKVFLNLSSGDAVEVENPERGKEKK